MQVYTPHDINLVNSVTLQLIAKEVQIPLKADKGKVLFQFPPIIKSDSRKATWVEEDMPGREPTAAFQTSGPREISLSWVYIVDAANNGWTTGKIATQVKQIRGYFARVRNSADQRLLVVRFKYGLYGGKAPTTARIKSIDVKHSDTIIIPSNVNDAYPLRTDIVIELRLWNETEANNVRDLKPIKPDWY